MEITAIILRVKLRSIFRWFFNIFFFLGLGMVLELVVRLVMSQVMEFKDIQFLSLEGQVWKVWGKLDYFIFYLVWFE